MRLADAAELNVLRAHIVAERDPGRRWIALCMGTGCRAGGSDAVAAALREALLEQRLTAKIDVVEMKETGCQGFCERGPLLVIHPEQVLYQRVKPEDVGEIVEETILNGRIVPRLLYHHPESGEAIARESTPGTIRPAAALDDGELDDEALAILAPILNAILENDDERP